MLKRFMGRPGTGREDLPDSLAGRSDNFRQLFQVRLRDRLKDISAPCHP